MGDGLWLDVAAAVREVVMTELSGGRRGCAFRQNQVRAGRRRSDKLAGGLCGSPGSAPVPEALRVVARGGVGL